MKKLFTALILLFAFNSASAMEYVGWTWTEDQVRGYHTFVDYNGTEWNCPMNKGERVWVGESWACSSKYVDWTCQVLGWDKGGIGKCVRNDD